MCSQIGLFKNIVLNRPFNLYENILYCLIYCFSFFIYILITVEKIVAISVKYLLRSDFLNELLIERKKNNYLKVKLIS